MFGMGAVDHEIGRIGPGRIVHRPDSLGERIARRQAAVGLDSERDRDRNAGGFGGAHRADRFGDIRQGEKADQIGARVCEEADLVPVISLRLVCGHDLARIVAVAARTDAAADHHRRFRRLMASADAFEIGDRIAVDPHRLRLGNAELRRPVPARAPGHAFEEKPGAGRLRDLDIAVEVGVEPRAALGGFQKVEGREQRQVDPLLKDHHGLEPAVGQNGLSVQLREVVLVLGHLRFLSVGCGKEYVDRRPDPLDDWRYSNAN